MTNNKKKGLRDALVSSVLETFFRRLVVMGARVHSLGPGRSGRF